MDNPFAHVAEREITDDRTSWCKLPGLFSHRFPDVPDPELELRHAGRPNEGYWNAQVTATANQVAEDAKVVISRSGDDVEVDVAEAARRRYRDEMKMVERDRGIYPLHVVVGWRNVINVKGESVDFSVEACQQFVKALAHADFQRARRHAERVSNYRPGPVLTAAAKTELAGNSESASLGS